MIINVDKELDIFFHTKKILFIMWIITIQSRIITQIYKYIKIYFPSTMVNLSFDMMIMNNGHVIRQRSN